MIVESVVLYFDNPNSIPKIFEPYLATAELRTAYLDLVRRIKAHLQNKLLLDLIHTFLAIPCESRDFSDTLDLIQFIADNDCPPELQKTVLQERQHVLDRKRSDSSLQDESDEKRNERHQFTIDFALQIINRFWYDFCEEDPQVNPFARRSRKSMQLLQIGHSDLSYYHHIENLIGANLLGSDSILIPTLELFNTETDLRSTFLDVLQLTLFDMRCATLTVHSALIQKKEHDEITPRANCIDITAEDQSTPYKTIALQTLSPQQHHHLEKFESRQALRLIYRAQADSSLQVMDKDIELDTIDVTYHASLLAHAFIAKNINAAVLIWRKLSQSELIITRDLIHNSSFDYLFTPQCDSDFIQTLLNSLADDPNDFASLILYFAIKHRQHEIARSALKAGGQPWVVYYEKTAFSTALQQVTDMQSANFVRELMLAQQNYLHLQTILYYKTTIESWKPSIHQIEARMAKVVVEHALAKLVLPFNLLLPIYYDQTLRPASKYTLILKTIQLSHEKSLQEFSDEKIFILVLEDSDKTLTCKFAELYKGKTCPLAYAIDMDDEKALDYLYREAEFKERFNQDLFQQVIQKNKVKCLEWLKNMGLLNEELAETAATIIDENDSLSFLFMRQVASHGDDALQLMETLLRITNIHFSSAKELPPKYQAIVNQQFEKLPELLTGEAPPRHYHFQSMRERESLVPLYIYSFIDNPLIHSKKKIKMLNLKENQPAEEYVSIKLIFSSATILHTSRYTLQLNNKSYLITYSIIERSAKIAILDTVENINFEFNLPINLITNLKDSSLVLDPNYIRICFFVIFICESKTKNVNGDIYRKFVDTLTSQPDKLLEFFEICTQILTIAVEPKSILYTSHTSVEKEDEPKDDLQFKKLFAFIESTGNLSAPVDTTEFHLFALNIEQFNRLFSIALNQYHGIFINRSLDSNLKRIQLNHALQKIKLLLSLGFRVNSSSHAKHLFNLQTLLSINNQYRMHYPLFLTTDQEICHYIQITYPKDDPHVMQFCVEHADPAKFLLDYKPDLSSYSMPDQLQPIKLFEQAILEGKIITPQQLQELDSLLNICNDNKLVCHVDALLRLAILNLHPSSDLIMTFLLENKTAPFFQSIIDIAIQARNQQALKCIANRGNGGHTFHFLASTDYYSTEVSLNHIPSSIQHLLALNDPILFEFLPDFLAQCELRDINLLKAILSKNIRREQLKKCLPLFSFITHENYQDLIFSRVRTRNNAFLDLLLETGNFELLVDKKTTTTLILCAKSVNNTDAVNIVKSFIEKLLSAKSKSGKLPDKALTPVRKSLPIILLAGDDDLFDAITKRIPAKDISVMSHWSLAPLFYFTKSDKIWSEFIAHCQTLSYTELKVLFSTSRFEFSKYAAEKPSQLLNLLNILIEKSRSTLQAVLEDFNWNDHYLLTNLEANKIEFFNLEDYLIYINYLIKHEIEIPEAYLESLLERIVLITNNHLYRNDDKRFKLFTDSTLNFLKNWLHSRSAELAENLILTPTKSKFLMFISAVFSDIGLLTKIVPSFLTTLKGNFYKQGLSSTLIYLAVVYHHDEYLKYFLYNILFLNNLPSFELLLEIVDELDDQSQCERVCYLLLENFSDQLISHGDSHSRSLLDLAYNTSARHAIWNHFFQLDESDSLSLMLHQPPTHKYATFHPLEFLLRLPSHQQDENSFLLYCKLLDRGIKFPLQLQVNLFGSSECSAGLVINNDLHALQAINTQSKELSETMFMAVFFDSEIREKMQIVPQSVTEFRQMREQLNQYRQGVNGIAPKFTLASYAARMGYSDILKFLLTQASAIECYSKKGVKKQDTAITEDSLTVHPLIQALQYHHTDCARLLVSAELTKSSDYCWYSLACLNFCMTLESVDKSVVVSLAIQIYSSNKRFQTTVSKLVNSTLHPELLPINLDKRKLDEKPLTPRKRPRTVGPDSPLLANDDSDTSLGKRKRVNERKSENKRPKTVARDSPLLSNQGSGSSASSPSAERPSLN